MSEQPTKEPDVDLDREDIRDRHGNRVTREYVERALADILDENTPSRRVMCSRSPVVVGWAYPFPTGDLPGPRSPDQLHRQAVDAAEREGKTVSALAREALEQYLRRG